MISSQHLYKFNNIRMINLRKNIYLIVDKLIQLLCYFKFVHTYNFNSILFFCVSMLSTVYISILSFRYTIEYCIILYSFNHTFCDFLSKYFLFIQVILKIISYIILFIYCIMATIALFLILFFLKFNISIFLLKIYKKYNI